ncbi:unnamed protein product, partial [Brassica napus]
TQPAINEDGYLKDAKVSEAVVWEATNEMLVIGELPLSFVESLAWKWFCNKVNLPKPQKFKTSFGLLGNDAMVLYGDYMHLRCSAHIINLIVKDGLAAVDVNVSAIRNAICYGRSNTTRLRSFELRVDSGKLTRGSLPLDCKTRWNSTYLMLSKALEFRVAFNKMEAEDRLYNDYFLEFDNGIKRIGPPEMVDWKAIERLVRFLVIFYNSTLVVSASTSLNSFKCYGEIVTIEKNLIGLTNILMCSEQWMKADMCGSEGRVVTMEQIQSEFEYEDKLKREFDSQATQEE